MRACFFLRISESMFCLSHSWWILVLSISLCPQELDDLIVVIASVFSFFMCVNYFCSRMAQILWRMHPLYCIVCMTDTALDCGFHVSSCPSWHIYLFSPWFLSLVCVCVFSVDDETIVPRPAKRTIPPGNRTPMMTMKCCKFFNCVFLIACWSVLDRRGLFVHIHRSCYRYWLRERVITINLHTSSALRDFYVSSIGLFVFSTLSRCLLIELVTLHTTVFRVLRCSFFLSGECCFHP